MPEIRRHAEMLAFFDEQPRPFAEGVVIFVEGQAAGEMYIVRNGTVTLRRGGEILKTLDPGEIFGEMGLIDHAPRTATAVAGPGCRLTAIDELTLNRLAPKGPRFALELLRLVVRRLRREMTRS